MRGFSRLSALEMQTATASVGNAVVKGAVD